MSYGKPDVIQDLEEQIDALEQENKALLDSLESAKAQWMEQIRSLQQERDSFRDVLNRNGFVQCDIPVCNCESWHPRYGLPERWEEVKESLSDAGHPLENSNGHLVRVALQALVKERDELKAQITTGWKEFCEQEDALNECHAIITALRADLKACAEAVVALRLHVSECEECQEMDTPCETSLELHADLTFVLTRPSIQALLKD